MGELLQAGGMASGHRRCSRLSKVAGNRPWQVAAIASRYQFGVPDESGGGKQMHLEREVVKGIMRTRATLDVA